MSNYSSFSSNLLSSAIQNINFPDYDALRISIASPEKIRSWSYGEVTKAETIHYRTGKPERDGLFCAKIFGTTRDYECLCGKYKKIKYRGMVCEKCGVEVTSSKVRRERMGHIELSVPLAHIWFFKIAPSKISTLLNIRPKDIENIIYFNRYVVVDSKMTELEDGQVLDEEEYKKYISELGENSFIAEMGAGAIRRLLEKINLETERNKLLKKIKENENDIQLSLFERLDVIEGFIKSGQRPEWMILTVLPVIPPDLRPLVQIENGQYATSDVNELYRRVLNRNNRLKKLIELGAPDIIVTNEKRMLQESVDALLDNSRGSNPTASINKRQLKSLADSFKGKTGRFRQNLLGKRVDYSGRSVIVVNPKLRINQCGIPITMALELFKPFIYSKLEALGYSSSIRQSRRMVETFDEKIWGILEDVVKRYPILLNRAPTLHRLSVQAFEPILVGGSAIQIHPLVCDAFNADFDGDAMAVHVPLSIEAQTEAKVLMMTSFNLLHPKDGDPIISPSEDMMFGLYYLTLLSDKDSDNIHSVSNLHEIEHLLEKGVITIHDKIRYRFNVRNKSGDNVSLILETTPGRIKIFDILPFSCKTESVLPLVNTTLLKKPKAARSDYGFIGGSVDGLLKYIFTNSTAQDFCKFCDNMMDIAFYYSTKSGLSVSMSDINVPTAKYKFVEESKKEIEKINDNYYNGLITLNEKENKTLDVWNSCFFNIQNEVVKSNSQKYDGKLSSIFMLALSGARGNKSGMQQLCGMRGLMRKTSKRIEDNRLETFKIPIISNFKEGLSSFEYFISNSQSRSGFIDVALRTANAGYLTRRFVSLAQDIVVTQSDCGTGNGILLEEKVDSSGKVVLSLQDRLKGRILSKDVLDENGKLLIKRNTLMNDDELKIISDCNIKSAEVRSIFTCDCENGICAKCYGNDLSTGKLVSDCEAVGIVAAQALGEQGTQLTMDSKHSTGVVSSANLMYDYVYSETDGKVEYIDLKDNITLNGMEVIRPFNRKRDDGSGYEPTLKVGDKEYKIKYGSILSVNSGAVVKKGDILSRMVRKSTNSSSYITAGIKSLVDAFNIKKQVFGYYYISNLRALSTIDGRVKITRGNKNKKSILEIESINEGDVTLKYNVPSNYNICVNDGDFVKKGDKILDISDTKIHPIEIIRTRGISKFVEYIKNDMFGAGVYGIYSVQGINVNEKHLEIIISKMLVNVEITNSGDTTLYVGQHLNTSKFNKINKEVIKNGGKPARAEYIVSGITESSLDTDSFISASSFQESPSILVRAAVEGKVDNLKGMRENMILGRLIPSGTGLIINRVKNTGNMEK